MRAEPSTAQKTLLDQDPWSLKWGFHWHKRRSLEKPLPALSLPDTIVHHFCSLTNTPVQPVPRAHSLLGLRLGSCLSSKFGRGKLNKEVSCSTDQCLIGQVLRDLGQQVVDWGHVAVTIQDFLLSIQHDLWGARPCVRDQNTQGLGPFISFSLEAI